MSLVLYLHLSSHSLSFLVDVSLASLSSLTSSLIPRTSSSLSRKASAICNCLFCDAACVRYSVDSSFRSVIICVSRWSISEGLKSASVLCYNDRGPTHQLHFLTCRPRHSSVLYYELSDPLPSLPAFSLLVSFCTWTISWFLHTIDDDLPNPRLASLLLFQLSLDRVLPFLRKYRDCLCRG